MVAALVLVYEPGAQGEHVTAPGADANEPAVQSTHVDAPGNC